MRRESIFLKAVLSFIFLLLPLNKAEAADITIVEVFFNGAIVYHGAPGGMSQALTSALWNTPTTQTVSVSALYYTMNSQGVVLARGSLPAIQMVFTGAAPVLPASGTTVAGTTIPVGGIAPSVLAGVIAGVIIDFAIWQTWADPAEQYIRDHYYLYSDAECANWDRQFRNCWTCFYNPDYYLWRNACDGRPTARVVTSASSGIPSTPNPVGQVSSQAQTGVISPAQPAAIVTPRPNVTSPAAIVAYVP